MRRETINEILVARFGGSGTNFQCEISNNFISTKNSIVFQGECSNFPGQLAIKWHRDPATLGDFEAVTKVQDNFGSGVDYAVPNFFAQLPEDNIEITEWVDAEPLSVQLKHADLDRKKMNAYFYRAGAWIYKFHNVESLSPTTVPSEQKLEALRTELAGRKLWADKVSKNAFLLLEEHADTVANIPASQGLIHGDFTPDNILISDGKTVGIDFTTRFRNAVVLDLANFITHLILLAWEPRNILNGLYSGREELVFSFLEGYQAEGGLISDLQLNWLLTHNFLKLYTQYRCPTLKPKNWYLAFCMRREVLRSVSKIPGVVRY